MPGRLSCWKNWLCLIKIRIYSRIERIEIFAESQTVELVAPFLNCLSERGADAATFVTQECEQTDGSAAKLRRRRWPSAASQLSTARSSSSKPGGSNVTGGKTTIGERAITAPIVCALTGF